MAVLRIHKKQQNFVILDKTCLNDSSLSWGAKGLHAYLISLPDDWKVRVSDLKQRATNGRDAVRGLLTELEQAGYIQKSVCRDDKSGRFGGLEYLVLEVPAAKECDINPATEKPFLVKNTEKFPRPENPFPVDPKTGNPSPESTTLININRINNKKLNNKTAASLSATKIHPTSTHSKAAAVSFSYDKSTNERAPIKHLSHGDSLIGSQLTELQKQRANTMIAGLNSSNKEAIMAEVEYCLLNPKHFTACGNDFGRKLNAIRGVIISGAWQTPAGMIQDIVEVTDSVGLEVKFLEEKIKDIQAEAIHFSKLLTTAKDHTRTHFEEIINQAQEKIKALEQKMSDLQVNKKQL